jgi:plastocyanin
MKIILLYLFVVPFALAAQTTHNVTVGSNFFNPSSLTIVVGDEVTWTNTGGSHNVNGNQATFASNPASFGNSVGSGWNYSFTFTIPGTYQYRCDPHSSQMQGTIVVQSGVGVEDHDTDIVTSLALDAPNNLLQLRFPNTINADVQVFNLGGQLVLTQATGNSTGVAIQLDGLSNAQYIVRVSTKDQVQSFPIVIVR